MNIGETSDMGRVHCDLCGEEHGGRYNCETDWQTMAPPTDKREPMPQTRGYWIKTAAMDQELILEQRAEIAKLKQKVNQLQQKLMGDV